MGDRGMLWPAAVLAVAQMVHGVVPVDEDKVESESLVGLVVGAGLLALTVAALVGILQRRPYGEPLAAWKGLVVADRKSAVCGKRESVRVGSGGRSLLKQRQSQLEL